VPTAAVAITSLLFALVPLRQCSLISKRSHYDGAKSTKSLLAAEPFVYPARMDNDQPTRRDIVRMTVLFEGGLAILSCLLGWLTGFPPWELFAWSAIDAGLGLVAAVPMLALLIVCARFPRGPFRRIEEVIDKVVRPRFGRCTVTELALIALAAGLGEELLFRGFLQDAVDRHFGPVIAIGITAILFGLMHPITPTYAVLATLAGAYLGWAYLASGNLLVAVVAHAFYDFAALVYLLRSRRPASPEPLTPE
jgi:membrane protease YdiL (CAAX protease family)